MTTATPGFACYQSLGHVPTVLIRATVHPGFCQETTQRSIAAAIYGHTVSAGFCRARSACYVPWRVQTAVMPTPKARTLTL